MTATKKKSPTKTDTADTAHKTTAAKPAKGANANEKKPSSGLIITMVGAFVLVGVVVVLMNMGSMVKATVEKIASDTLGVPVTLAALEIKPAEMTVTVTGLNVGNPQGFTKPSSFTIGKIGLTAETLSPELLVFQKIDVESTAINLEVSENATNLSTISRNVNSKAAAETTSAQQKQPPKIIVRELVFNGVTLNPSATLIGGDMMPVDITNLRLTGIGEKENGVLASEAITQVLESVTKTSLQAGLQAGYMQGMTPEALGDIKSQFGIAETFREQAKQGFENLKSEIKSLFGGTEEEAPVAPAPESTPAAPAQP